MKRDQRSATIGRERAEFGVDAPIDRSPAQHRVHGTVAWWRALAPGIPDSLKEVARDFRSGIAVRYGDVVTRHIDIQAGGT